MVKRKSTPSKMMKAAAKTPAAATRGRKKRTTATRASAARTHAASVTNTRKHTYTDHPSHSYEHYASIMKAIILFLGFVLLLAILANIFAPTIERRPMMRHSSHSLESSPVNRASYASPSLSNNDRTPSTPERSPANIHRYIMPEGATPAPQ